MARNTYVTTGPTRSKLEWEEWSCPFCNTRATDEGIKAPKGWYRCPACGTATPQHEMDYRVRGILVGDGRAMPLTIRWAGSATDTASALTVTVPNVTAVAGDLIMVVCCHDGFTEQGNEYTRTDITWGSVTGFGGGALSWLSDIVASTVATQTTMTSDSTLRILAAGGTNDLVVTWSAINPIPVKKIVSVFVVSGLTNNNFITESETLTEGNDGSPTTNPQTTVSRDSVIICGVGTVGPETDDPGTWTGGFTRLARTGTTTGSDDRTLDVGYRINTEIVTATAAKTGMTARLWLTNTATFNRP